MPRVHPCSSTKIAIHSKLNADHNKQPCMIVGTLTIMLTTHSVTFILPGSSMLMSISLVCQLLPSSLTTTSIVSVYCAHSHLFYHDPCRHAFPALIVHWLALLCIDQPSHNPAPPVRALRPCVHTQTPCPILRPFYPWASYAPPWPPCPSQVAQLDGPYRHDEP